jgi:hypothetical protein
LAIMDAPPAGDTLSDGACLVRRAGLHGPVRATLSPEAM